jgi:periplasmic divalent cation tolerance protein
MDYALVLVTLPATVGADDVVRDLLARRLIAGANIIPDLATMYVDGGPLVTTRETLFICRTQVEHAEAIRAAIEEHTGERDFEVSVLAATAGNPGYADWVARALAGAAGASKGDG